MAEAMTIEDERLMQLGEERREEEEAAAAPEPTAAETGALSKISPFAFAGKIKQHWMILGTAAIFDIFALIPFISVVFNFLFALILYLYFMGKKTKGKAQSDLMRIALPTVLGSCLDWFISILPVNLATALIRILVKG